MIYTTHIHEWQRKDCKQQKNTLNLKIATDRRVAHSLPAPLPQYNQDLQISKGSSRSSASNLYLVFQSCPAHSSNWT